jgi:hypothetical protein
MAEAQNVYDQGGRYLTLRASPGVLGWLLRLRAEDFDFQRWLDTRTSPFPGQPERTRDRVAFLRDLEAGGLPWAVLLEFQLAPDPLMFGRALVYLGHVWLEEKPYPEQGDRFHLGVVVVHFTGKGQCSRHYRWKRAKMQTGIRMIERDLEPMSARRVLADIAAGRAPRSILAFVPLMKGADKASIINEWLRLAREEPDEAWQGDHRGLALVFAEAANRGAVWKESLKGWNVMVSQQVREWQDQARAETAVRMLLTMLEERFGPVPELLKAEIQGVTDLERLYGWVPLVMRAPSLEQFRNQIQNGDV